MFGKFLKRLKKPETIASPALTSWDIYSDYVKIHPTVIIDPSASIIIFNPPDPPEICLEIGEYSHIYSTFNILRPNAKIKIGKRCQLGMVNFISAESIMIGDDVLMAWGITIMDTDSHAIEWKNRANDVSQCYKDYLQDRNNFIKNKDWSYVMSKQISIGDRAWIGFNASILKGVSIGQESIIGAGSVVVDDIPSFAVSMGNPAKVLKTIG